jgi:cytochrome c-type biogenesis protein CcmH
MVGFGVIAAVLLLLALWWVPGTLWRRRARTGAAPTASASRFAVLRTQRRQLDEELARGVVDAAQHRALRAELERRALDEEGVAVAPRREVAARGTLWLLGVAVPVLALGLYGLVGTPAALSPQAHAVQGEPTPEQIEAMVAKLAARMEAQAPGNVADTEGWVMLGRSYAVLQRYPQASRAFARALQLQPQDAQILADLADALAMQQGGNLQGEPQRLLEQALQSNPAHPKALALAGTAAYDRKDYAAAIGYWSRARAVVPGDSEFAQTLDRSIADAGAAAGAAGPAAGGASAARPAQQSPAAAAISGRIRVSPALAARVAPGDTLFVYARAVDGPRMPLATLKRSAADLPLDFKLDDGMALSPQLKLSGFANVIVGARLSSSGDAMPRSGDLEGQSAPLAGRRSGIEITIDSVRP